jgi:hypothetical protein
MKRCSLILIIIGIIFFSILPVVVILNIDFIIFLIKWEKTDTITLLTSSILPFILAALTALFGLLIKYFVEKRDEREREINSINNTINAYNLLMIKSIKRYNTLMKLYYNIIKHNNRFEKVPILNQIVERWKNNTIKTIEFSSSDEFIGFASNQIKNLVENINENTSILGYFENMGIIPENIEKFNTNDSLFIFKLRDSLLLSDEEKNLLTIYCDNFGVSNIYDKAIKEYNLCIDEYVMIKQNEYININKLTAQIGDVILKYYHLLELVILESFILYNFLTILINKFKQYYNDKNIKYKVIDEIIKPYIVNDLFNELIKYIDIQKIYESLKIKIKDDDKKMM